MRTGVNLLQPKTFVSFTLNFPRQNPFPKLKQVWRGLLEGSTPQQYEHILECVQ